MSGENHLPHLQHQRLNEEDYVKHQDGLVLTVNDIKDRLQTRVAIEVPAWTVLVAVFVVLVLFAVALD